jgi:hypothetical protein
MRTRLFAVAFVSTVCIPSLALAQRNRGGGSDPSASSGSAPAASSSGAKTPSGRDLQDLNPASLLIDKKKKASLPDSTVAQLKAVEKKLNDRNAPFFASYDSVRKWTMPLASGAASRSQPGFSAGDNALSTSTTSAAEQAQMQSSLRELRKMMAEYRDRRSADMTDALAVVPDAQKKAATDLLNSQNGDLDKLIGKP